MYKIIILTLFTDIGNIIFQLLLFIDSLQRDHFYIIVHRTWKIVILFCLVRKRRNCSYVGWSPDGSTNPPTDQVMNQYRLCLPLIRPQPPSILSLLALPDMPPGTDCPYPIRIWAFFEMIRPYHAVIRIWGKLLKNNLWICVAKPNSFIVTQLAFSAKFPKNGRFCFGEARLTYSVRVVGLIWLSRHLK